MARLLGVALAAALGWPATAHAAEVSPTDTLWVLIASAMVLLMTPGLALFYGGLVHARNVLSTMVHSVLCMGVVTLQWVVIGYSLAFAPGNIFVGGLDHVLFAGVGLEPGPYADSVPGVSFAMFQLMFAILTPALISGAFAERIRFESYLLLTVLWATLVYDPVCHWVWGEGGWLRELGALDFAGGTVVHISSGVAGLAVATVLGHRHHDEAPRPHNMAFVLLGAGLLWFGWFGFNAGSALAVDGAAVQAFTTTHLGGATGAVAWSLVERIHGGRVTSLGVASGAVAGLVAITPACAFVTTGGAIAIGLGAGVFCYGGVHLKDVFGYDDALDAFGLHGVGGTWGALATGIFAAEAVGGTAGALEGNLGLLGVQALSVLATAAYAFVVTWGLVKVLDLTIGLRVPREVERAGLDHAMHGEQGYVL